MVTVSIDTVIKEEIETCKRKCILSKMYLISLYKGFQIYCSYVGDDAYGINVKEDIPEAMMCFDNLKKYMDVLGLLNSTGGVDDKYSDYEYVSKFSKDMVILEFSQFELLQHMFVYDFLEHTIVKDKEFSPNLNLFVQSMKLWALSQIDKNYTKEERDDMGKKFLKWYGEKF